MRLCSVCTWANNLASLGLSFLICKTGKIGMLWGLNEKIFAKHLG